MRRRFTDAQLSAALRFWPNVSAVAEALGVGVRGLQRRLVRMRRRGVDVPPARAGRRRTNPGRKGSR